MTQEVGPVSESHPPLIDHAWFRAKVMPVYRMAILRSGPFEKLNYKGIWDGEIGQALALLDLAEREAYKLLDMQIAIISMSGERVPEELRLDLVDRREKISAAFGKDVFSMRWPDTRFSSSYDKIDWPATKDTILRIAKKYSPEFQPYVLPDRYRKLFRRTIMTFRVEIWQPFGLVVGFEHRPWDIDQIILLFHGETADNNTNFRNLFELPPLIGTRTRPDRLAEHLTACFEAIGTFAVAARSALTDPSEP